MRALKWSCALIMLVSFAGASAGQNKQDTKRPKNPYRLYQLNELQQVGIKINGKPLKVWVMDTATKRAEGMMFLTESEVRADEGMIFVFGEAQSLSFWMKNTKLALDGGYVDDKGVMFQVLDMKPYDERSLPSTKPAKYVVEFKKGTFKSLGIKAGMKIELTKGLKSKD